MNPAFQVLANNKDITDTMSSRLVSLSLTDAAGMESDLLEITLSDRDDAPIALPPTGAELSVSLGYEGAIQRMGLFIVDEVELSGWPAEMTIRARATPFDASKGGKSTLQSQKTRSWPAGTKLADLVAKVAKEHGLAAAVAASLKSIALPHLDQSDESDLHFLVRVALKYDAIVKPAAGKLILAKRGESKSVGGADLPTVTVTPPEVSRFRAVLSRRDASGTVVAYYHATKAGKRHEVQVGSGEPVQRLRMYHPTAEMALAAARAELDRRARKKFTVSLTLPGRADLVAEGRLVLDGFREGVAGEWVITRVEHRLDGNGYVCDVEAETPNREGTPDSQDEAA